MYKIAKNNKPLRLTKNLTPRREFGSFYTILAVEPRCSEPHFQSCATRWRAVPREASALTKTYFGHCEVNARGQLQKTQSIVGMGRRLPH